MSLIVLAGDTAVFNVGVHDSTTVLTYLWRDFGFYISNAIYPTLTLYNVQSNYAGIYSVVVTNVSGSTNSSNATLTVVTGPKLAIQNVVPGTNVTFVVDVNGYGPVNYQWRFNDQDIPGATTKTLMLTNVQPPQAGAYRAAVWTPVGLVTTSNAMLNVQAPRPTLEYAHWETNGLGFQVIGLPFTTYIIQASTGLSGWADISTNTAPASGKFDFVDPAAFTPTGRFYRALQP